MELVVCKTVSRSACVFFWVDIAKGLNETPCLFCSVHPLDFLLFLWREGRPYPYIQNCSLCCRLDMPTFHWPWRHLDICCNLCSNFWWYGLGCNLVSSLLSYPCNTTSQLYIHYKNCGSNMDLKDGNSEDTTSLVYIHFLAYIRFKIDETMDRFLWQNLRCNLQLEM